MYEYVSCDESSYVFFFYAVRVPFLVNVDITIKLHKFSTISRWIDNDNLHAKNVWQMPPVRPVIVIPHSFIFIISFLVRSFNRESGFHGRASFTKILLTLSLSTTYIRHKYANARRDKNATVICDIIILSYFDISYK